jgi:5-methylcytosine-specific restriction enzyme subunit McrC
MDVLSVIEHQAVPIADTATSTSLSVIEADALDRISRRRPGFCHRSYRTVQFSQYCGIVSLGTRVLEILPKSDDGSESSESRRLFVRLLRDSMDIPLFRNSSSAQLQDDGSLLEVFIRAFMECVARLARRGLPVQYQDYEDDLVMVRGRIVVDRQLRALWNRVDRIACNFDELTIDNAWNRTLKAGLTAVRPWITRAQLFRQWTELAETFRQVGDAPLSASTIDRLVFDRHARRYASAIEWIRCILEYLSPALRAGSSAAPSLLFDMNALFQSAVAANLRRFARDHATIEIQTKRTGTYLASVSAATPMSAVFELIPDLILLRNGTIAAIGDTKWKLPRMNAEGYIMPDASDLYQMHAYASAFECKEIVLLYPWHSELAHSKETAFNLPNSAKAPPVVHVACIDLYKEPFAVRRGSNAGAFGLLFSGLLGAHTAASRAV